MSNKDAVTHAVMQHESLYKVSTLLDQFKEGLNKMGVLPVIEKFPELFVSMFTFTGDVSCEDVLAALYVDPEEGIDDILLSLTHKYIKSLSKDGMCTYNNYKK